MHELHDIVRRTTWRVTAKKIRDEPKVLQLLKQTVLGKPGSLQLKLELRCMLLQTMCLDRF